MTSADFDPQLRLSAGQVHRSAHGQPAASVRDFSPG